MFKQIDIFAIQYSFVFKECENFKTNFGAGLTIGYLMIMFALFFGFGIDLYTKKNPRVSFNSERKSYELFPLSNQNFTFAYRIEDTYGYRLDNDALMYLDFTFGEFKLNSSGQWEDNPYVYHIPERCTNLPNMKEKEEYFNISLSQWYCINFNNKLLGGFWDTSFIHSLLINVRQCIPGNKRNISCVDHATMQSELASADTSAKYFFSYIYQEALPEMDNVNDPLKVIMVNKFEMLNLKAMKRLIQNFNKVSVKDDVGWIFEDYNISSVYSLKSTINDFNFKDEYNMDVLYSYFCYFTNKYDTYNRNNKKVQEVLALIGGFSKLFHTIISMIFHFFQEKIKFLQVLNGIDFRERFTSDKPEATNTEVFYRSSDFFHLRSHSSNRNQQYPRMITSNPRTTNENNASPSLPLKQKLEALQSKKIEVQIGNCRYLAYSLCKTNNKMNEKKMDLLKQTREFMKHVLDVRTYTMTFHEIQTVKQIFMTSEQMDMMGLIYPSCNIKTYLRKYVKDSLPNTNQNVFRNTNINVNTQSSRQDTSNRTNTGLLNIDKKLLVLAGEQIKLVVPQ